MNKFAKERGGSLIEVIVASAVLIIIVVGTFASFKAITNYSRQAKFTQSLTAIAKQELNRVRAVSKVKPLPAEIAPYTNKNYYNLQTLPQAGEQLVTYDNIYSQKDNNADAKFPVYRRITFATVNANSDKEYKKVTISLRDSFQPPRFSTVTFVTNISQPVVYDTRTTVDRGYLAGKVTNRDTNTPVDGATVKISRVGYPDTTISTNGAGDYLLELPVGNYTVKADKPGINGYWDVTVTPVTVSGGYTTTTQNFSLQPFYYGTIRVTVLHSDTSLPLSGIPVWLILIANASYVSKTTDSNGQVVFSSVKIDQKDLTAWDDKYKVQAQTTNLYWASTAPTVDLQKDVTNSYTVLMTPKRFATLNFTVQRKVDSTFKISGSRVDLQGDNIAGTSTKYTDSNGMTSYPLTINQTDTHWRNGKYYVSRDGYQALGWTNITPVADTTTREITVELDLSTLLATVVPADAGLMLGEQKLFTGSVFYNAVNQTAASIKSWELTPGTTIGYLNTGGLTAGNYNTVTYTAAAPGSTQLTFRASITIGGLLFTAEKVVNILTAPPSSPSVLTLSVTPTTAAIIWNNKQDFTAAALYNGNPVSVTKIWRIINPGIGSFSATNSAEDTKTTSGVTDLVSFWGKESLGITQLEVSTSYLEGNTVTALVDITVSMPTFLLTVNPTSATIPPAATQTFTATATYGTNVTAAATFSWWLSNSLGTLSATSGPTVTFTANNSVGTEYLNLTAVYTPTDGSGTKTVTQSMTINIQPGGGFVQ